MPLLFSLSDSDVLYLTARVVLLPYVTCGAETEKRVYSSIKSVSTLTSKNVEHVPKCTRLSPSFSDTGSKVIQVTLRVEKGEPGDEATVVVQLYLDCNW